MASSDRKKGANIVSRQEPAPGGLAAEARAKEEISFLRQKFNSLMIRGHYAECFKLIEDNLRMLYHKERWPENFLSTLRVHRRCYPSMNLGPPYEEYLTALLRKNDIPWVFARLIKGSDTSVVWTTDYFKDLAIVSEGREEFEEALGYCDIMLKMDPGSSNACLLKAWILEDLKHWDDAREFYERALALSDKNYQAHHGLAKYYLKKDSDKALFHIGQAVGLTPNEASFHATKANILLAAGKKQEALASYEQASMLDPLNPQYPYLKGEVLLSEEQTIAAIRQYSKAVGLNEQHLPSLKRLAALLRDTQPESALPYVNTVTTLEPENVEAALLKAQLHELTGDPDGAVRQYRQVLKLDGRLAAAHGSLGALLLPTDEKKALESFEKAVELEPQCAKYHLGKARALQKLGETEQAVKEYKTTVALDKASSKAWAALGHLYLETNPREAVSCLDKAIALTPENSRYYASKGEALLKLPHRSNEALEAFNSAVLHDPGNAGLQLRLAALLEQTGNTASAAEHYRLAVSLDHGLEKGYYGLARLTADSEPETALLHINSALNLNAGNGDYYYLKSRILSRLGLRLEALEQLKQTLYADEGQNARNAEVMQEISQMLKGDSLRVALMYLNRAIDLSPQNSAYICARADLLYAGGQESKALKQYEQAISLDPQNHQALFGAGRALAGSKDKKAREKALEYFDKAMGLAPAVAAYPAGKAGLLARSHETYTEALACYDTAIVLDRSDWATVLAKADLLFENNDLLSAQESYRRVLLINPDCLPANVRMCMLLAEENPQAALHYITHALALAPETPLYHVWRGRLLQSAGDAGGAEEEFRAAISLGESSAEVFLLLAQALWQKLPETALKYARSAADLRPDWTEAHLLCGDIHFRLLEYAAAADCFETALAQNGRCAEAYARLAEIAFRRPDKTPGPSFLEQIDKALALDDGNVRYLALKAEMLLTLEPPRLDEAAELLTRAVKGAPEQLGYRESLVEVLRRKRSFLRHTLEKGRLKKLRRAQEERQGALRSAETQT